MLPAASAGATFHVDSMNGAFHGVMITAGPAGIRTTVLRVPFDDHVPLLVRGGEVGVGAEVDGAAGDEARRASTRGACPCRRVSTMAISLGVRVDQIGQAVEVLGPAGGPEVGPAAGTPSTAAVDRGVGGRGVAAGDVGELPRPVERRAVLERGRRRHPLAADEVVAG